MNRQQQLDEIKTLIWKCSKDLQSISREDIPEFHSQRIFEIANELYSQFALLTQTHYQMANTQDND